jgi:DNA-binding SARP family transcriptional activator/tetratricopeptide (TPR) repeat protein
MRFEILGPLRVLDESRQAHEIPGARQRTLLAALLVRANQPVPLDQLAEIVWDGKPPRGSVATLRTHVMRLRRVLPAGAGQRIVTRDPGYLIDVSDAEFDLASFDALYQAAASAIRERRWTDAAGHASDALAQWRGTPFVDVASRELARLWLPRLEQSRLHLIEWGIEAELRLGRHEQLISRLHAEVAAHPLHERFWAQLMLAQYRDGQQADALASYRRARRALVDELGVEPGAELRRLHQQVLAADPSLLFEAASDPAAGTAPGQQVRDAADAPDAAAAAAAGSAAAVDVGSGADSGSGSGSGSGDAASQTSSSGDVAPDDPPPTITAPAQLPGDLADFTGRGRLVERAVNTLGGDDADQPGVLVVTAISGIGGVGKTALAVHVAHQLRARFPDGQLYVNLRGVDADPLTPSDVLARFLRDLGAEPSSVPADHQERAARYRSMLSGRRLLILLDNAKDAAQVRDLLPGDGGSRALVTSRSRLPDLAGAAVLDLDTLDDAEAHALFERIVGARRTKAEPDAVADVLSACAGLPLAIRIAAGRLAGRAGWTVRTLADRLADERELLDELAIGDLAVRASFAVSYQNLPPATPAEADRGRCFRMLGVLAAPSMGLPAVAALVAAPERHVERALEALVDANLVQTPAPGRYGLHDLLRVYAAERFAADETPDEQAEAFERLLAWYLRAALAAARAVSATRRLPEPPEPPDAAGSHDPLRTLPDIPRFADYRAALAWFETEYANLLAALYQGEQRGLDTEVWQLAVAMFDVFQTHGHYADWVSSHEAALRAARRLGDQAAEGWLLSHLAVAHADRGDSAASIACLRESLRIDRETGNRRSEAVNLSNLGYALIVKHDYAEAVSVLTEAAAAGQETGHEMVVITAYANAGYALKELDRLDEAEAIVRRALAESEAAGISRGMGDILAELADIARRRGDLDEAIATGLRALRLHEEAGRRFQVGETNRQLGRALLEAGQVAEARQRLVWAEAIFRELDHPLADEVRDEIAELPGDAGGHRLVVA